MRRCALSEEPSGAIARDIVVVLIERCANRPTAQLEPAPITLDAAKQIGQASG